MDHLDDELPEPRREIASAVTAEVHVTAKDAEAIVRASLPLWDATEDSGGLVESWVGGEFCDLLPSSREPAAAASRSIPPSARPSRAHWRGCLS